MNPIIDQLVMLLSTDWFLKQWSLFGMQSDMPVREAMKEKCRAIVVQLFNDESNYWEVSFEDKRILGTYSSFFAAATDSKLHISDIDFLRQIADQTEMEAKAADNISLLNSLTQLLISDSSKEVVKNISLEFITIVTSIFTDSSRDEVDLISLCLNSNTDWDKKIRDKTSDLPEYLADFAKAIYQQMHHFIQFWARLVENTSMDERAKLIEWYRGTAVELTKRDLEIPKWMA